jgi:hypothetical protein
MSQTVTQTPNLLTSHNTNLKVKFDWVADSSGAVTFTSSQKFNGVLCRAIVNNLVGVTEGFSITVTDEQSIDLLGGNGATLPNTGTLTLPVTDASGAPPVLAGEPIGFTVSGAGAAAAGTLILYFRP